MELARKNFLSERPASSQGMFSKMVPISLWVEALVATVFFDLQLPKPNERLKSKLAPNKNFIFMCVNFKNYEVVLILF
jgi:hypothetical protein